MAELTAGPVYTYFLLMLCLISRCLYKYEEFSFCFHSLEEVPTQKEEDREVVNFRVVYKKETLPISFELDQPVSKLKSRIHELTGA